MSLGPPANCKQPEAIQMVKRADTLPDAAIRALEEVLCEAVDKDGVVEVPDGYDWTYTGLTEALTAGFERHIPLCSQSCRVSVKVVATDTTPEKCALFITCSDISKTGGTPCEEACRRNHETIFEAFGTWAIAESQKLHT